MEIILQEYEAQLSDIGKILHFLDKGMYKLRGHPFLRSGTQHYSEYWEVRKAVQMVSLVDRPVMKAVEITDSAIASVQGLFKGMDKYFLKDSRELKKGCKQEVVGQIKQVANSLNDAIVTLNAIREELHDATGSMWTVQQLPLLDRTGNEVGWGTFQTLWPTAKPVNIGLFVVILQIRLD